MAVSIFFNSESGIKDTQVPLKVFVANILNIKISFKSKLCYLIETGEVPLLTTNLIACTQDPLRAMGLNWKMCEKYSIMSSCPERFFWPHVILESSSFLSFSPNFADLQQPSKASNLRNTARPIKNTMRYIFLFLPLGMCHQALRYHSLQTRQFHWKWDLLCMKLTTCNSTSRVTRGRFWSTYGEWCLKVCGLLHRVVLLKLAFSYNY